MAHHFDTIWHSFQSDFNPVVALMSSLGRIQGSLVAATQETTLALANLNFDFALYKVEAPTEYQGLGKHLSKHRLHAAECGDEHIFARKLAALFSNVLPSTPNLVRAYGSRASEIVQELSNDGAEASNNRGLFSDCRGPDATSIWAAATSGSGAISVHLLACMLARIWSASEAQAIWDEIIQVRKMKLAQLDSADPMKPTADYAAQIEVTRSQISKWDTSVRSWLEVADRTKIRQQKQLTLLIHKASIPINDSSDPYTSVLKAWTTALETIELVVSGISQSITDGSVLLALTSWHLYPDMFALGAGTDRVAQRDPLIPTGAVITLGQIGFPAGSNGEPFWSLPLSYLKYYGDPVVTSKTLGEYVSRLSMSEFVHVVFGSILSHWGYYGRSIPRATTFMLALNDFLVKSGSDTNKKRYCWVTMLAEAAEKYTLAPDNEKKFIENLVMRGHRRYGTFLSDKNHEWLPLFGLADPNTLIHLAKDRESAISILRFAAQSITDADSDPDSLLIRYDSQENWLAEGYLDREVFYEPRMDTYTWEYATAIKRKDVSKTAKTNAFSDLYGHTRWRAQGPTIGSENSHGEEYKGIDEVSVIPVGDSGFQWLSVGGVSQDSFPNVPSEGARYECLLGSPLGAAVFKRSDIPGPRHGVFDIEQVITVLRQGLIDRNKLVSFMDGSLTPRHSGVPEHIICLRALAAALDVYKSMPGATCSSGIFSLPLKYALWLPSRPVNRKGTPSPTPVLPMLSPEAESETESETDSEMDPETGHRQFTTLKLRRSEIFSCILLFENHSLNLHPSSLEEVLAISAGNSLYVAMPLIRDPFESPGVYEMKHVVGNIGKPGISLMIPPAAPKVRKVDESLWVMINHAKFDGCMNDAFQHTSLHLSFTRYELPVRPRHGDQGVEANFVETLVSIFDRKEWVADLNVLQALNQPTLKRVASHGINCCHIQRLKQPMSNLTSIDSWDEFLDQPDNPCVVRSTGNWLGRLATTALSLQQGATTVVLEDGNKVCWECLLGQYIVKPAGRMAAPSRIIIIS